MGRIIPQRLVFFALQDEVGGSRGGASKSVRGSGKQDQAFVGLGDEPGKFTRLPGNHIHSLYTPPCFLQALFAASIFEELLALLLS